MVVEAIPLQRSSAVSSAWVSVPRSPRAAAITRRHRRIMDRPLTTRPLRVITHRRHQPCITATRDAPPVVGDTSMKTIVSHRLVSVAVAALLAMPGVALAQSAQSPGPQGATPPPPAASGSPIAGHPVAGKTAEERVERRIKELH